MRTRDLTRRQFAAALARYGWRVRGTQVLVPGGAAELVFRVRTIDRRATVASAWWEADRADKRA
jgi:hypothetical protein